MGHYHIFPIWKLLVRKEIAGNTSVSWSPPFTLSVRVGMASVTCSPSRCCLPCSCVDAASVWSSLASCAGAWRQVLAPSCRLGIELSCCTCAQRESLPGIRISREVSLDCSSAPRTYTPVWHMVTLWLMVNGRWNCCGTDLHESPDRGTTGGAEKTDLLSSHHLTACSELRASCKTGHNSIGVRLWMRKKGWICEVYGAELTSYACSKKQAGLLTLFEA